MRALAWLLIRAAFGSAFCGLQHLAADTDECYWAWLEGQGLAWGAHDTEFPERSLISLFFLLPPRSHPTILDIPNQLYYDGELQACADVVDRERFCRWEGLPQQVRPSRAGLPPPEGTSDSIAGLDGGRQGDEPEGFLSFHGVQGFPIIFHGVMGKDEREGNSPSFFNPEEAATVTSYLKQLLAPSSKKGKARLSPRSVGVISPYRKQVRPSVQA